MGRKFKKSKYSKEHKEHIEGIEKLTKKAKKYEPEPLQISKAKPLTSDDLPDRPSAPKGPGIKMGNNSLRSDRVAKPSGRPGTIKEFKARTLGARQLKSRYKYAPTTGGGDLAKFKRKAKGQ